MVPCHIKDGPFTESEISAMSPEEKLVVLQGLIDAIFFGEKKHHPITTSEWSTLQALMRDTPVITTVKGGKMALENAWRRP